MAPSGRELLIQAALQDVTAQRQEFVFELPKSINNLLLPLLNNPKTDCYILYLFINIICITIPSALVLFFYAPNSNIFGSIYLITNYALFLQRFMLALHYSQHRRLFKYDIFNTIPPLILCPFFGVPSGLYRLHHCIMHHVGNNRKHMDASSTEQWQRDNILHFICYWMRYAILGWIEVPYQAIKTQRYSLFIQSITTESIYLFTIYTLYTIAPTATTWIFIIPFCISSFALMFGNWSQHIFINQEIPDSNYGLAYNCVGCVDNRRTFNDGYHIVHHSNSQLHWSEMPQKMIDTLDEHEKNDALVFVGIGFFDVGLAVFMGRFQYLVEHLSRYSEKMSGMKDEELIEMLKSRLRPVLSLRNKETITRHV